jgi:hypothetical protein
MKVPSSRRLNPTLQLIVTLGTRSWCDIQATASWNRQPPRRIFGLDDFPARPQRRLLYDPDRRRDCEIGGQSLERDQLGQQGENALGVCRSLFRDAVVSIDKTGVHEALPA